MTVRMIRNAQTKIDLFDETTVSGDPVAWLTSQAQDGMLLLAHAEDGVIWGQVVKGAISTPSLSLIRQAALRPITLQAARLFNQKKEIFLWRTGESTWQARALTDDTGDQIEYLDDTQLLWGTVVEDTEIIDEAHAIGFSLLAEGVQGLRHAVPLLLAEGPWDTNRLRLGVRHYLANNDGWRRIHMSRLTGLWYEEETS